MSDYLISMFIDDELDLDEKIEFVTTAQQDPIFVEETVSLLEQEKILRADMVPIPAEMVFPVKETKAIPVRPVTPWWRLFLPPAAGFATACSLILAYLMLVPGPPLSSEPHRFVIYRPDARQAAIIGSFTDWAPVPLEKIGTSGYWAISLPVSEGEHRYSYLVDDGGQIADPTVLVREQDDFGGENSILRVQGV